MNVAGIRRLARVGERLGVWGIRLWGLAGLVAGLPWILAANGIGEEPEWIHEVAAGWTTGFCVLAIVAVGLTYWLPRLTFARDPRFDRASDESLSLAAAGSVNLLILMLTVVHSEPAWLLALGSAATVVCVGGLIEGVVRLMRVPDRGR